MIHNGIEYGMMQAFAEGFALLAARKDLEFDLGRLAETWRHGSVVRSWLLDLSAEILKEDEDLQRIAPVVADSGEGRWTALESVELGVPAPVITMALMARFSSQGKSDYARKLLAMMRAKFGGHHATFESMIVVVMGVSGCGKSTIGQPLAERLGLPVPRRRRIPSARERRQDGRRHAAHRRGPPALARTA